MQIYNTLNRKKEEFIPQEDHKVKIYACGPTVYNYFHLGNARPLVVFDTLRRYLEYQGYEVKFVQNFTDIDDKVIQKANAEGKSIKEVSEFFIKQYYVDADGLNVKRADVAPIATKHIDDMKKIIQTLIDKGYAYVANDGVYYRVNKFKDYLKLSRFNKDELLENVRIDAKEDSGKENPADFVLWKFKKPGEPAWEAPWGEGRPGWHLECSTMSMKYLGSTLDIHCGGKDLIFPHHENEIAQSEAYSGKEFSRYWMHNGFITVNDEKMSKSKHNFFLIREIANKYGYMPIRLFLLNSHYRSPINYSIEMIEGSKSAYERLLNSYKNLKRALKNPATDNSADTKVKDFIKQSKAHFIKAMDDDLNTADALAALFDLVKFSNKELEAGLSKDSIEALISTFEELSEVLGIKYELETKIPDEVLDLVNKRQEAKDKKDYDAADAYRDKISDLGYKVIDTANGPEVEVKD